MTPILTFHHSRVPINDPLLSPLFSPFTIERLPPCFVPLLIPLLALAPLFALLLIDVILFDPLLVPLILCYIVLTFFLGPLLIPPVVPCLPPLTLVVATGFANGLKVLPKINDSRTFPLVLLVFIPSPIEYNLLVVSDFVDNII